MALRIIHSGNSMPYQLPVDPSAEFQPGMLGQMMSSSGLATMTVSNGVAPMFIIADVRTKAFTRNVIDEQHVIPVPNPVVGSNGKLVTPVDIVECLDNANIIKTSFSSLITVVLKERNGVIIVPAGTELNYSLSGGALDTIYTRVRYTHEIAGYPGNDSTFGSKRCTVWYGSMIIQTDMIEMNAQYPLNMPVYCSSEGKWTTKQDQAKTFPAIGVVMAPPSMSNSGMAEFKVYL
jgi:hypothetical protein